MGAEAAGAPARRWLDLQRRRHQSRHDFAEYLYGSALGRLPRVAARLGEPDARVIDVGCGLGGAAVAYAVDGARVTAVDEELYDGESIAFARRFARSKGAEVDFLAVSGDDWPLPADRFDIAFLDSVIEHASHPARLLGETLRVLRPGGLLLISFPVFYGPFGGHTYDYIRVPWFHLLPSPLVRAVLRNRRPRGEYVTPAFIEAVYLSLNRMTLRRFRRLLAASGAELVDLRRAAFLTVPGNQLVHDLRRAAAAGERGAFAAALRRIPRDFGAWDLCLFLLLLPTLPLMRVPVVQELFLGGVRATLRKPAGTELRNQARAGPRKPAGATLREPATGVGEAGAAAPPAVERSRRGR